MAHAGNVGKKGNVLKFFDFGAGSEVPGKGKIDTMSSLIKALISKNKKLAYAVSSTLTADESIPSFIEKLQGYIEDYKREGKPDNVKDLTTIIMLIKKNEWQKADDVFNKNRDLRSDTPNSSIFVEDMANEQYLEKQGLKHWCEKPGEYVAYRAGSVSKNPRGLYFAPDFKGASAYSHGDRDVHKYHIAIKKPLVARDQKDAIEKFGKKMKLNLVGYSRETEKNRYS